jgi:hypothetical protein
MGEKLSVARWHLSNAPLPNVGPEYLTDCEALQAYLSERFFMGNPFPLYAPGGWIVLGLIAPTLSPPASTRSAC